MVKVSDCKARGPGFDPRSRQDFFALFHMYYTKEMEVIKNLKPIITGPFFRRRSIGPLPSCLVTLFLVSRSKYVKCRICGKNKYAVKISGRIHIMLLAFSWLLKSSSFTYLCQWEGIRVEAGVVNSPAVHPA